MSDAPPDTTLTLTPPPIPMPPNWQRTITNDLVRFWREHHGWARHTAKRPWTDNPPTGRDYRTAGQIATQTATTEVLWSLPYAWGITDPQPRLGVPMLAWHLLQLDAINAMNPPPTHAVDTFLNLKPTTNNPATIYRTTTNRHGTLQLRRNSDYAPPDVTLALTQAASAATTWQLDPLEVANALPDELHATITLAILHKALERDAAEHAECT